MQILHRFAGSIQGYLEQIPDPDLYRPDHCPLCQAQHPLIAWGFYSRSMVDLEFDDFIRVRRYLCVFCRRTVSLLPEFALPYLRFSISVISLFLVARLLEGRTLKAAAAAAYQPDMPYQRGQFWIRRFRAQAIALCVALVARTAAIAAATFVAKALHMLQAVGWIPAHRFLFTELRTHLLGWPGFLAPAGIPVKLRPAVVQT
ncbi:MAG: DUF6431 domain-containing protein [Acidobacteriota bacterium]